MDLTSAGSPVDQTRPRPESRRPRSAAWRLVLIPALAGAAVLPLSLVGLVGPFTASASGSAALHVPLPTVSAATYVPMSPLRLLDTRSDLGFAAMGPGATSTLQVTGVDTIPSSGVTAVVVNVTVTGASTDGYLSLFPAGGTTPLVSNLNFSAGETVANLVTVPVSQGGQVSFFSHLTSGTVEVVADLQGYYLESSTFVTGLYVPLTSPIRIADTRGGSGQPDSGQPLGAGSTTALTVTGSDGVPVGASAVVLNLTAVSPSQAGYITVYPAGSSQPTASNLSFSAGEQISNRVIAEVGTGGQVEIYNYTGTTNLLVDVDGYYTGTEIGTASNAGAFYTVSPQRIVDTRSGLGGSVLAAGGTATFQVAGEGGIPAEAETGPVAVAANVTAANPTTGPGYLTVYADGEPTPASSDVNWSTGGQVQPNFTVLGALSDSSPNQGRVEVHNGSTGTVDVLIDVFGYFAEPPALEPAVQ